MRPPADRHWRDVGDGLRQHNNGDVQLLVQLASPRRVHKKRCRFDVPSGDLHRRTLDIDFAVGIGKTVSHRQYVPWRNQCSSSLAVSIISAEHNAADTRE